MSMQLARAAPRENFPLPRELRDEIYKHVLSADAATRRRDFDLPGFFTALESETNILQVNRTIRQETRNALYRANAFVIVSFNGPAEVELLTLCGLAMIIGASPKYFKDHSMYLEIIVRGGWTERFSFVTVIQEVPRLLRFLQLKQYSFFDRLAWITSPDHSASLSFTTFELNQGAQNSLGLGVAKRFRIRFGVQLRKTSLHKFDDAFQKRLLAPFKHFSGQDVKVRIASFPKSTNTSTLVSTLCRSMMPTIAWPRAAAWDFLRTARAIKDSIDAEVSEQGDVWAAPRYNQVSQIIQCSAFFKRHVIPDDVDHDINFTDAIMQLHILTLDSVISAVFLHVKSGSSEPLIDIRDDAAGACRALYGFKHIPSISHLLARCDHAIGMYTVSKYGVIRPDKVEFVLEELVKLLDTAPDDVYIAHDVKALSHYLSPPTNRTRESLSASQPHPTALSFHIFPFEISDHSAALQQHPPEGLEGWVDTAALAQLTDVQKQEIRRWQGERGLSVTEFE
ncbi:hypothetical protein H2203_008417 [Taxawa tesnikishii (nom. ined.)]|nr:hypothetical protein H2203_008417 [Dothideales sp. JES 119]